ncbi:hypothetical protein NL393_39805, partial [Klebsiella pneumoniae]|nr:hypothetical protein [Klebsiella pneumoniae]
MEESWSAGQWMFTIAVFLPCIVALLSFNIGATFVGGVLVLATIAMAMFHPLAALALWACTWLVVLMMLRSRKK